MTFDEILEQVIALLKRQGRLSYPALKIRFNLDDDYLEAIKAEIIEAQQLATDENGRVLVWAGDTKGTPESTSQPDQTTQPDTQEAQPTSVELPSVEPHTPEAERRQLTVMFCDLVDSTRLSSELDLEDYREVVREYQKVCSKVITRFDGHVAQLLGDGLLVYFGYPMAHEDDAQRAVRTGLGIVDAIRSLNIVLEQEKGITLAVRLGIHTGLVVVGKMGGSGRQEQLALGETPNVAARIQGLAEPDTLMVSEATYRLMQGYFDCEPLGEHDLRGVSQPIAVYRVLGDSGIQSRLDVASSRGLTPLVGREAEVTLLLERWEQAKDKHGQVLLLSGEAGIGKSRLVQVLKDHVADEPQIRFECRSLPYFTNSALYPVTDFLQRTLRFQTDDTPETKLDKLEQNLSQYRLPLDESVPLFASLLSLSAPEDRYPPLNLSPQRQRQKTLESIVTILLELAERQPILFILEDLHWTDPSTLELLDLLIDQTPTASLCVLLTCRPEFQPTWQHRSYLMEVTLNRLSHTQVESMAQQVTGGKELPAEVLKQIIEKTDGVPLFVEEMTKAVLESGVVKEIEERYELTGPLSSLSIPSTLQDSLMARLDRLVTAKGVAQYGAVIGRQFSYALLHAVSQLDNTVLDRELGRLVDAELVYQRGLPPQAIYAFKHALIQDTAYQSLLRSTRQQYHQRIAWVLVERFPEIVEAQPELLAHHYTEAGCDEQAIGYWQRAGQHASARSAYIEAMVHLTKGLEVLYRLPDTSQRAQRELEMQMSLGPVLMATKGHASPDVERVYNRARTLCQQAGETSQNFPVLWGLWRFYYNQARLRTARELSEQLLTLDEYPQEGSLLMAAHAAQGTSLYFMGEFAAAQPHLQQCLATSLSEVHRVLAIRYGVAPEVQGYVFLAQTLWTLGYPEQALQQSHSACALAQELAHPPSIVLALYYAARLHQSRRETSACHEHAEAVITLATEHGLPHWVALGIFLQGWVLAMQGQREAGVKKMHQGLTKVLELGVQLAKQLIVVALTEFKKTQEEIAEWLCLLSQEEERIDKSGQGLHKAEIFRLKGVLLLRQTVPDIAQPEACFHQALDIARRQQAKSWELRAATSLARLWQSQGKRQAAHELLAPVYDWFTEGFDTADLLDAKKLLDEFA